MVKVPGGGYGAPLESLCKVFSAKLNGENASCFPVLGSTFLMNLLRRSRMGLIDLDISENVFGQAPSGLDLFNLLKFQKPSLSGSND